MPHPAPYQRFCCDDADSRYAPGYRGLRKNDRDEFIKTVQEAQAAQQTTDITKKKRRLAAAQKRAVELEKLLCKIYEDNASGKLPDARYAVLDAQYGRSKRNFPARLTGWKRPSAATSRAGSQRKSLSLSLTNTRITTP